MKNLQFAAYPYLPYNRTTIATYEVSQVGVGGLADSSADPQHPTRSSALVVL